MRFLLIEDSDGIGIVLTHKLEVLRAKWPDSVITIATTMKAAHDYLMSSGYPDISFVDLKLPDSDLHQSIAMALQLDPYSPVIIMTGFPNEAREMLRGSPIEVIPKDEHFARGNTIFEAIGRALFRSPKTDKIADNIRLLRELIDTPHASPQQ